MPLSALVGGILGGPAIEFMGRKTTILATSVPFVISWLLIACAVEVWIVLVGRALSGFCVGIASLSLPVYLGETVQPEVRGTLGLLPTAFGNIGKDLFKNYYIWNNVLINNINLFGRYSNVLRSREIYDLVAVGFSWRHIARTILITDVDYS